MIAKFTFNYNGGFEKKENAVFQQGSIGVDSYQVFTPFLTTTQVYIKTKRNGDLEFSLWKQLDYNSTIGGWLKTATQDELLVDGEMKVVFKFNNLVSQETSLWVRKGTLIVPEMTTYEALRDYVENQEQRIDHIIDGTTDIAFDKTGTNLNSDFVEEAIKEVNTKSDANAQNIEDMKDGTTIVKKAEKDKNGNDIVDTYETKSDATSKLALKADKTYVDAQDQALDGRVEDLETANMIKSYTYNPSTHVLTFTYYDNTTTSFDLPLESAIVGASYDSVTKDITFTLQSGATLVVPLDDLISGLASETWVTTNFIPKTALKTSFSATPLDTNVISEKLAKDTFDYIGINTPVNVLSEKTLNEVFKETQLLSKPTFEDGSTMGWIGASSSATLNVISQKLNATGTGSNQNITIYTQTTKTPVTNDEYWSIVKFRVKNDLAYSINVYLGDNTVGNPMSMAIKNIISPIKDKWYIVSGLKKITTQSGQVRLYIDARFGSTIDATNSVLEVEYIRLYNTTEIGVSTTETQLEYFYNVFETVSAYNTTRYTLEQTNKNSLDSRRQIFLSSLNEFDNVTIIPTKDIAYIDIVQIGNRTVYVQGKKYDDSYVNLSLVNVSTGLSHELIGAVGVYQFVTKDFKEIKIYTRVSDERYCEIYYVEQYTNSIKPIDYSFEYLQVKKAKVISTIPSSTKIRGYRNGRLFANINTAIVADDNDGNDGFPISIGTLPTADIKHLLIVENGNYVIVQSNGKILTSTNGTTWVEKVNMINGVTQLTSHELFGSQTYKNIVLVSEYLATKTPAPSGYKAYLSIDSGATFTTCFNLEEQNEKLGTNYHLHAVKYDPYEDMLWAITGDGQQAQMVFYSKDMGANWYTACKQGFLPVQATEIIPLQNCVLFSPDARLVAMLRYNRPKSGTQEGSELDFEIAKVFKESWGRSNLTEVPIASTAYIDYQNSIAYFGLGIIQDAPNGTNDDDLKRGNIFVTNGYDFIELYKDTVFNSVAGVYGENEKIACRLHHENSVVLNVEENYPNYKELNILRLNKANKTQSSWITVDTFQNSWTGTLKYRKNDFGELQIRATLTVGTGTINTTIMAFPSGYFITQINTPIIAFNSSDGGSAIFRINVGGAFVNGQTMTTGKVMNIAVTIPID